MKTFIRGAAAAVALSLLGVSAAEAQLDPYHLGDDYLCSVSDMAPTAADCDGWFKGNASGSSTPGETKVINHINTIWSDDLGFEVTSGDKTDAGVSGGPFQDFDENEPLPLTINFVEAISGNFVVAMKAGRSFALYLFMDADNWTSLTFNGGFSYPEEDAALSNAIVYGGETASVPEPTTWFLLGSGLLALSGLAWRRREEILA